MGKVTSSKMCLSLQTYFYFPETDEHINFPIIKLVLVYHFVLKQEIYHFSFGHTNEQDCSSKFKHGCNNFQDFHHRRLKVNKV